MCISIYSVSLSNSNNKTDMKELIKLPLEEFQKLYAIKLRLETYLSYMEDNRGVLKHIAPTFLEDAKEYIKEYNELTNEKV